MLSWNDTLASASLVIGCNLIRILTDFLNVNGYFKLAIEAILIILGGALNWVINYFLYFHLTVEYLFLRKL